MKGLSFTDEQLEKAMENLQNSQFPIRDFTGAIIGFTNNPPMEILIEEIRKIQKAEKEA